MENAPAAPVAPAAPEAAGAPADGAATAPETAAPTGGTPTAPEAGTGETSGQPETFGRDYVEGLRGEAAGHRTKAKALQEELDAAKAERDAILEGLRKVTGGETAETSPEDLVASLTAERDRIAAERDAIRLEQTISAAARVPDVNADLDLLVPYLKGTGALSKIDATADDLAAQVAAVVTEAVTANPKLRATPVVPGSSGTAPEASKPAGPSQVTREEFSAMTAAERLAAVKEGRATSLLGGK